MARKYVWTDEGRRLQSERMAAFWAQRRALGLGTRGPPRGSPQKQRGPAIDPAGGLGYLDRCSEDWPIPRSFAQSKARARRARVRPFGESP